VVGREELAQVTDQQVLHPIAVHVGDRHMGWMRDARQHREGVA